MNKKINIINRLFIFLLYGIRPFFGPAACRYQIGCTQFAAQQLQQKSLLSALWHISKRVLSCNPFTKD